jgi:hypothetical protein
MPRYRGIIIQEVMTPIEVEAKNEEHAKSEILTGGADFIGDPIYQEPEVCNLISVFKSKSNNE